MKICRSSGFANLRFLGLFFVFLGVSLFRVVVNRVVQNKIKTLGLFLVIPNELIERMANRKMKTLKREDKDKPDLGMLRSVKTPDARSARRVCVSHT